MDLRLQVIKVNVFFQPAAELTLQPPPIKHHQAPVCQSSCSSSFVFYKCFNVICNLCIQNNLMSSTNYYDLVFSITAP